MDNLLREVIPWVTSRISWRYRYEGHMNNTMNSHKGSSGRTWTDSFPDISRILQVQYLLLHRDLQFPGCDIYNLRSSRSWVLLCPFYVLCPSATANSTTPLYVRSLGTAGHKLWGEFMDLFCSPQGLGGRIMAKGHTDQQPILCLKLSIFSAQENGVNTVFYGKKYCILRTGIILLWLPEPGRKEAFKNGCNCQAKG